MSANTTIARPYAKAVFAVASASHTITAWGQLLKTASWLVQQPQVSRFLQSPRFTAAQHYAWFVEICASLLDEQKRNFLHLLATNKRLMLLVEISNLFDAYRIEQEQVIAVQVKSAFPLQEKEQQQLAVALKRRLQREVLLEYSQDSSLLGGVIISTGDLVIDDSVRGKLARLRASLIDQH